MGKNNKSADGGWWNLEIEKISALTLSWTLVHPITEDSPLYGLQQQDFQQATGEFIVFIKAFDDMFSSTVVKRTSYTFDEVVYGAQFVSMFYKFIDFWKISLRNDCF